MPSKTFFNLPKEKQQKLLETAFQEFANKKYPDVSINKIITNANIPRGSFYMYFNDKEDLFEYLIDIKAKYIEDQAKAIIKEVNGNLQEFFINIFTKLTDDFYTQKNLSIFKNIFIFNRLCAKNLDNPSHKLYLAVKDYIDKSTLKDYDLEFIFSFISHNLFFALDEYSKTNDLEKVKDKYLLKLNIIFYGICKEDKKC